MITYYVFIIYYIIIYYYYYYYSHAVCLDCPKRSKRFQTKRKYITNFFIPRCHNIQYF